ncbi:MAG: hypothetical protein H6658_13815 [Ardenticatenaceae bacterium]|nr:hypothetical protein [Ardenticatenaceae bacterium]
MNQAQVAAFVAGLEKVQQTENFGYTFFFIGDDQMVPFVTIAHTDNEYETVSNLNREGVFRINIGVSRQTFNNLLGEATDEPIDYTVLNTILPHPDYAKQNFICILNPAGENIAQTKQLIAEAHGLALARFQRKTKPKPE